MRRCLQVRLCKIFVKDTWRELAPIHLANDAGASTAAQSGEMKGVAPPLHFVR
jgi:hypothetical protein